MNVKKVKDVRREVRKQLSTDTAVLVLDLHRFIRRGFFGRLKWLILGR